MSVVIRDVSRVRVTAALANAEILAGSPATRGTYYDLHAGGYLRVLINDDICIDDWESSQLAPVVSSALPPDSDGEPQNEEILAGSPATRGTAWGYWVGNYRPAIRGTACGTGFTGLYVEAPRLLIDAGGTGGPSGVTARRATFH